MLKVSSSNTAVTSPWASGIVELGRKSSNSNVTNVPTPGNNNTYLFILTNHLY